MIGLKVWALSRANQNTGYGQSFWSANEASLPSNAFKMAADGAINIMNC